uniref:Site-2 protease family protein n=1 Tax=Thermofilum pendens TaxID=2269 RepID=A0A7C1T6V4_THEPE
MAQLFYKGELAELLVAVLAVFAVFAGDYAWRLSVPLALKLLAFSFVIYVPHELAHKFVALYYGFPARYRLDPFLLLLTFLSAIPFVPVKFIVPGAVYVYAAPGYSKRVDGVISAAGPLVNVLLGFYAYALGLHRIAQFSFWIAFFNLLPIGPLDGRKVLSWNPVAWALMIGSSLVMMLL